MHESGSGTSRTWRDVRRESAIGGKADYMCSERVFRFLTHRRHGFPGCRLFVSYWSLVLAIVAPGHPRPETLDGRQTGIATSGTA